MDNNKLMEELDTFGAVAAQQLRDALLGIPTIQPIGEPFKAGEHWAQTFDVLLPNGQGHIEFTAVQTGWGGEVFTPFRELD